MRDWANAIRPYNFSHHPVGANRIRPRLYSPPFAFVHVYIHPIIICLYHYFIEQMPIGRMRFAPTYFRIIPLTSLSWHIQLDEYIMGEFDSPLHWHAYLSRIPYGRIAFAPNQHSPQFSFILIYIFHHFIHSQWANSIRPYIGTHIYIYIIQIPCGRIAFAPICIHPIYFPTTSRINLKTPLHTPQKT